MDTDINNTNGDLQEQHNQEQQQIFDAKDFVNSLITDKEIIEHFIKEGFSKEDALKFIEYNENRNERYNWRYYFKDRFKKWVKKNKTTQQEPIQQPESLTEKKRGYTIWVAWVEFFKYEIADEDEIKDFYSFNESLGFKYPLEKSVRRWVEKLKEKHPEKIEKYREHFIGYFYELTSKVFNEILQKKNLKLYRNTPLLNEIIRRLKLFEEASDTETGIIKLDYQMTALHLVQTNGDDWDLMVSEADKYENSMYLKYRIYKELEKKQNNS